MNAQIDTPPQLTDEISNFRRYAIFGALVWTLLLSGLFITYVKENRESIRKIGCSMAQASLEKDLLFRRWASRHGGVYVPVTAATPPSPYLAGTPERDITTPSGKRLTLISPAYMSRQLFEIGRELPDLPQGHITSLNPIRPENAPDPWERQALKLLDQGAKEVLEPVLLNGLPHLRLMRPIATEKPCLGCHAAPGNNEGNGRGGISITQSLVPIQKTMDMELIQEAFIHSFIWLAGLGLIWFGTRRIIRITCSLRDERNSLRESELRFRILADSAPVMIWMSDQTKGCTYFNKVWCTFTGRKLDDLLGDGWARDVHPEDLERCLSIYGSAFDARKPFSMEYRLHHFDGEYRWVSDSGVPRWKDEIGFSGFIGSCFDITERKLAEEERLAMEQQLHHSQKLESLGVLAGGIAHDFNNILTVIMGHCYLALEEIDPESYKEHFQQIEAAGNRAADLCRQMLTYAGRNPLVQTRFSLWLLVDEVVRMLQSVINKNVTFELDMNQRIPEIKGDTGQIQQIIMNLIINASEAIGDAHGTIRVVLTNTEFEADHQETDLFGTVISLGGYACLEVTDNGIGMDEETQKRIFDPFYTTKCSGRGLGMSAIHGIIKSHNGILQLTSRPGVGTTFKVYFPVPDASEYEDSAFSAPDLFETADGTILLVEDEKTLRTMGSTLLETMGFSVLTAQHGCEALDICREHLNEIDVILLDLIMPVMGGLETYRALRSIAPALPIIICSGYGVELVDDVIKNDRHAGFMHKPYKPEELRRVIMEMKA